MGSTQSSDLSSGSSSVQDPGTIAFVTINSIIMGFLVAAVIYLLIIITTRDDSQFLDRVDSLHNSGITVDMSGDMTINLVTKAGTSSSTTDPICVNFRNSTLTNGTYETVEQTSALSLTVPFGTTLGSVDGIVTTVHVYLINNSGILTLGVSKSDFDESGVIDSTASIDGGSDASLMYTANAITEAKAFRKIGKITSTQDNAGTWVTTASNISLTPFEYEHHNNTLARGYVVQNMTLGTSKIGSVFSVAQGDITLATVGGTYTKLVDSAAGGTQLEAVGLVNFDYPSENTLRYIGSRPISASIAFEFGSRKKVGGGATFNWRVRKNGSTTLLEGVSKNSNIVDADPCRFSLVETLNTGDYVELLYTDDGSTSNTMAAYHFSIEEM